MTATWGRTGRLALALLMVVTVQVAVATPSHAALVLRVTTTADVVDTSDGVLSLREAVSAVVQDGGLGHEIRLSAGTYELSNGALPITRAAADELGVAIVGAGMDATTIDGMEVSRVFDVFESRLHLEELTVANGRVEGADARGGAVRLRGTGSWLTAEHVRFARHHVSSSDPGHDVRGSAIATEGPELTSFVGLVDSVVEDNVAEYTGDRGPTAGIVDVVADSVLVRGTRFEGNGIVTDDVGASMIHLDGFQFLHLGNSSVTASSRPIDANGTDLHLSASDHLRVENVTVRSLRSSAVGLSAGGRVVEPGQPRGIEHVTLVSRYTALLGSDFANDTVIRNSILAGGASSCSFQAGTQPVSGGGNVRTPMAAVPNDCALTHATDREVASVNDVALGSLDTSGPVAVFPMVPTAQALDHGVASDVGRDALRRSRPSGSAPDAGAYEHQAPLPADDTIALAVGESATVEVLANDEAGDAPLDAASLAIVSAPGWAGATAADGRVRVAPSGPGSGTVVYEVCQVDFATSCSTARLAVDAVDAPGGSDGPADPQEPGEPGGPGEPVGPDWEPGVIRVWGQDRFESAAAVSRASFDPGLDVVFLATGTNFPDALAGGPLAAHHGAPILLTGDGLPEATATELARLRPASVVALGGPAAVPAEVLAAAATAAGGAATDRYAGEDRFETAAEIARRLPGSPRAFLATGANFPDALAAGPVTAGAPILLARADELPAATQAVLRERAPAEVVAVGGTAVLSESTLVAAGRAAGDGARTSRLAGEDRYATAVAIAELASSTDVVFVSTGTNFPDALSAAPVAAAAGAGIVLTPSDQLAPVAREHLAALRPAAIVVLGGAAAVSADVADALEELAG